METILVVEDDSHIREVVCYALKKAGYQTLEAGSKDQAIAKFGESHPDLVILDIGLPSGAEGLDVCRDLRRRSSVPIVFLSAKIDEIDRILGLELGGDDYVTKPFSPRELVARVKAVLRRMSQVADSDKGQLGAPNLLEFFDLRLDLDRYKVHLNENEVILTVTEFNLVRTFLRNPQKVITRQELIEGAYDQYRVVEHSTIDSHIRRLRKKLKDAGRDPVEVVRGVGYQLTVP